MTADGSPEITGYISTALTGLDEEARRTVDETVAVVREVCAEPDVRITAYFPGDHTDPVRDVQVPADEVYRIDRERVKSADVVIVLGHFPSIGVGQELNMALDSLLPIVFLAPESAAVSRMARGVPAVKIELSYRSLEELRERLHDALRSLRPDLEARQRAFAALDSNLAGAKVRAHRERRRLSRDELAAAIGMTAQGVAFLESSPDRQSDPSLTQLRRLAAVLGVGVSDLV